MFANKWVCERKKITYIRPHRSYSLFILRARSIEIPGHAVCVIVFFYYLWTTDWQISDRFGHIKILRSCAILTVSALFPTHPADNLSSRAGGMYFKKRSDARATRSTNVSIIRARQRMTTIRSNFVTFCYNILVCPSKIYSMLTESRS